MQDDYNFSKMKQRRNKVKATAEATKSMISIRMDAIDLGHLKEESYRLGVPYQTLINSILHRYVTDQLVDKKELSKVRGLFDKKRD